VRGNLCPRSQSGVANEQKGVDCIIRDLLFWYSRRDVPTSFLKFKMPRYCRVSSPLGSAVAVDTGTGDAQFNSSTLDAESWEPLPDEMKLRLIRFSFEDRDGKKRHMVLATTLTDHGKYDWLEPAALYAQRWDIELRLRDEPRAQKKRPKSYSYVTKPSAEYKSSAVSGKIPGSRLKQRHSCQTPNSRHRIDGTGRFDTGLVSKPSPIFNRGGQLGLPVSRS